MTLSELLQNPWIQSLGIVLAALVVATIIHLFLNIIVRKFTERTKTDLDDQILEILIKPIYVLMILIGLNVASRTVQSQIKDLPWIDKVFFVIYALIIAYVCSKVLGVLIMKWFHVNKKFEKTPKLIVKVVSVIVFLIAGIIILDKLSIEITPFIATLGIGGLAIGLALQNTLSNLFAGIHIISDEPIRVGDFIEVDGTTNVAGYVDDIGWRSTRIKTLSNNIIIVPNAKLADSVIINDTMSSPETGIALSCSVSYDSDLDKVERISIEAAKKIQKTVPGAKRDFQPSVRYNKFGEYNIEFSIGMRAEKYVDRYLMIHELVKELKKTYKKNNIQFQPIRQMTEVKLKKAK